MKRIAPLQTHALALSNELVQSRWFMIEQAQTKLPTAFLAMLIGWLTVLFASFGLLAPPKRDDRGQLAGLRLLDVERHLPDPGDEPPARRRDSGFSRSAPQWPSRVIGSNSAEVTGRSQSQ